MKILNKLLIAAVVSASLTSGLLAEEKTAEDLVKSMKKEDISYAQLMNGMAMANNNIQTGIISMNKFLVDRGIDLIRTHPAPREKPWVIMGKENQEGFKSLLVYYDKKMDEDVEAIEKAVNEKDWYKAFDAATEFSTSCINCHTAYKDEVKYIMD
jgi:hypothetical protein